MKCLENSTVETRQDVCVCHVGDRCAVYAGMSAMLLGPASGLAEAAMRIAIGTEGCPSFEYLDRAEIHRAAVRALSSFATPEGSSSYVEERRWLFGEDEFDPFLNGMAPNEATYLASDRDRLRGALAATYSMAGYAVPQRGTFMPCLGHMGVELDFMRHCLEHVRGGDDRFADVARCFFGEHLREWGVLFAVVLRDKAIHPGMRYLSFALDQFIATEAITFRHSLPALCVQRSMAD